MSEYYRGCPFKKLILYGSVRHHRINDCELPGTKAANQGSQLVVGRNRPTYAARVWHMTRWRLYADIAQLVRAGDS